MVTVVDAINLLKDYSSHDLLRDREETLGEGDERTLVNLLVEQIDVPPDLPDPFPVWRRAEAA